MVEITMGKIIGHYKKVIFIICLTLFMLPGNSSTAAFQEDELFEKAYEYYLSYQPGKALEYCDIFLYNFPDSSAKDAVLFWKAKSLMQLKRTEEAVKIFSQMRKTAPESPFISFIEKELSSNKNDSYISPSNDLPVEKKTIKADTERAFGVEKIKELQEEKEVLEGQLSEINKLKQLSEKGLIKALEDKNRMEVLLEDSKKINEDLSRKTAALESDKNAEMKNQNYNQLETDTKNLRSERDNLQRQINELKDKDDEIKMLKAKADERENEYRKTTANLLQLKEEKEALEEGLEEKDRKIAEAEKSIALLSEKAKEAEKERDREKRDTSQDLSRLSSEKISTEDELKKKQRRIEELTAQVETSDNQLKQLRSIEELRKTKESDDDRKQTEAELTKLQGERDTLQEKSEELKTKDLEMRDLTAKTEEQEREKQAAEALLKNLTEEKAVTAEKLKENESRLAALEEELKKAENSAKISADSLQKLTEAYEYTKKTNDTLLEHEKGAMSEIASLKDIMKPYETPVLKIGENQFSSRQILDDHRESSEVMRKIHAHNIIWRYDSPYDDFIIEHVLLKKAGESGIKEDKALYNSFLKQYSLSEKEKDYLLRYLIINNVIKKKLSEIIANENLIRKYYELNKEKYIINTEINQVKILSLKYSPREELEKSLVAVDFQQQVSSGKSLETVYKYNSNVLSFDAVKVSDLPDFVKERVQGLKDGEMSNIISYDNKFMILQMQGKKIEYRSFEDVYKEFREKSFDDPTTQAHLLQEWFNELRKGAGSIN